MAPDLRPGSEPDDLGVGGQRFEGRRERRPGVGGETRGPPTSAEGHANDKCGDDDRHEREPQTHFVHASFIVRPPAQWTIRTMASERITTAAGGIVWRRGVGRRDESGRKPFLEVATIHRPSYDDWTFPKGKTDPGEALQTTAVREIAEETGLRVRLGHPLPSLSYAISGGTKTVAYWCARAIGPDQLHPFKPNREVDE